MNVHIDAAERTLESFNLRALDGKGLGRWDEEYYLVGLYHPLRSMNCYTNNKNSIYDFLEISNIINPIDLYIHVPFCYTDCSFCHFYKEIIRRNKINDMEEMYIDALLSEAASYREKISRTMNGSKVSVQSIQVGGGTPSTLSPDGIKKIFDGLGNIFDLTSLKELKFEFHPELGQDSEHFGSLIKTLKSYGLTTAIIDIESISSKVLSNIGRKQGNLSRYENLVELCKNFGIQSIATAVICGLPHETVESFQETLLSIADINAIDAINIYPLMFKPSDVVFWQRRRNRGDFVSPKERDLMTVLASVLLEKAGFVEGPSHFFRRESHTPHQQMSKADSRTLLGLGPASFGYLNGSTGAIQYMNTPNLKAYVEQVHETGIGLWRASQMSSAQKHLRSVLFKLNSFSTVPHGMIDVALDSDHNTRLRAVLDAQTALGLLKWTAEGVSLTTVGQLRNAETLFYLAEPDVTMWPYHDEEYELLRRYEFFPNVSLDNQVLFSKYLRDFRQELRVA